MAQNESAARYPQAGRRQSVASNLPLDDRGSKVRFSSVKSGGFLGLGETISLISVGAINRIEESNVLVDQSCKPVKSAPSYCPELVNNASHHRRDNHRYGLAPWIVGFEPPNERDVLPMIHSAFTE